MVRDYKEGMATDARSALMALLRPNAVAVVGASDDPSLPGGELMHSLLEGGFPGPVYPVVEASGSARAPPGQVLGHRSLPSLRELPEGVDLAVVVLPPERSAAAAAECVKRGVRAVIVPVPGFAEAHEQGRETQRRMVDDVTCGGARLLGPNTHGLFSSEGKLNLTTGIDPKGPHRVLRRRVALLSQAGELDQVFISTLQVHGEGLGMYVSLGNAADISFQHLIPPAAGEPGVAAVALMPAGELDLPALASTVRNVSPSVPVLVAVKARGRAAVRAARAHVGGATDGHDALPDLEAAGAIIARDLEDLADRTAAVVLQPRAEGRRVSVISTSGGAAVAAASHLADQGLDVPVLAPEVQHALMTFIPDHGTAANPVNLTGHLPSNNFFPCVDGVLGQPNIDGAVVLAVGVDHPTLAPAVAEVSSKRRKPVVAVAVGAPKTETALQDSGIPVYPTPARAARAYQALAPRPI
jgi:acetyltransferase